ncbi:sensor histidine kinase [Sphingomonas gilva]|uniref:histidine kinase n=1 Tax=Sphingomonas gilva TaxID=2305907 RepID=A0A396RSB2_9SPHN|nr:sensor histidine kinase [Sphingomonas gilva]RHW18222.1 sensor histidine kinase [Sphingomonas gilva]
MKAYSLRWRLLIGGGLAILAAMAIAWLTMILLFDRHLERRVEFELRRHANQLVAAVDADPQGGIALSRMPTDPQFETPASGLYWQVSTADRILRSRSLWDQALARPTRSSRSDWYTRHVQDGPFAQDIFLVERLVSRSGDNDAVLIQVAQDRTGLRAARREFGLELGAFLTVLGIVLALAAWLQVSLGLQPLTRVRREVMTLKRNPAERLSEVYPEEVEPLIDAINDLAGAREADLRRARQRAADLAHGMKTPLAALSAQARQIKAAGGDTSGLDKAVAAAAAAVEAELARARAAATRYAAQDRRTAVLLLCQRLVAVLERTEAGARIDFQFDIPTELELPLAEDDLSTLLGVLLENAVRFARRLVTIRGGASATGVSIIIDDDGPGMTPDQVRQAVERGIRLDQRGGGHGLGLSIATDLIDATGGRITLERSPMGGLRAVLGWTGIERLT